MLSLVWLIAMVHLAHTSSERERRMITASMVDHSHLYHPRPCAFFLINVVEVVTKEQYIQDDPKPVLVHGEWNDWW